MQYTLITGTSSGLGYKMAETLLEMGHMVIGVSRRGTSIEHSNFIDIMCDVKDEAAVEEMYELISNHTDKLHHIVLNAGIFEVAPLVETSNKEFVDQLETNIIGAFHVLKHAPEFLINDVTHVITISSLAGKKAYPNIAAYTASKFGLNGMIESVREEWKELGVRFSTLMPGAIDTPIWNKEAAPEEQMMKVEDFISVFEMVVKSSKYMQFPEIIFTHKDGI